MAAAVLLLWGDPFVSRAEPKGVVIPKSVNIRKTPEQGSEVIGSSTAGKEIDIRGQVDSGGITWYQVYIDANTLGYVRADMIEKKGDETIPTVTVSAGNDTEQPADAAGAGTDESSSQTPPPREAQRRRRRRQWISNMRPRKYRPRSDRILPHPILTWIP